MVKGWGGGQFLTLVPKVVLGIVSCTGGLCHASQPAKPWDSVCLRLAHVLGACVCGGPGAWASNAVPWLPGGPRLTPA